MQQQEQKISLLKRNILHYLENQGVSKYAFYQATGISRGTLDNDSGLTEDGLRRFLEFAPNVRLEWLLYGSGPMTQRDLSPKQTLNEPMEDYGVDGRGNNVVHREKGFVHMTGPGTAGVPLLPAEAFGGYGGEAVSIKDGDIKDRYVIPDFVDVDFMIRVKGNSMYPKYNSGDVVACRMIKGRFYQWNKVHVLATREQGVLIKRLKKGPSADVLVAVSDNKDYDPFEIPVDGVIRLE